MSNIVMVESPAKAKTIEKYLGPDYKVMASIGHIRDLLPKNGSVNTDEQYKMTWEISTQGRKVIKDISSAIQNGDNLFLATDPDREGEAISWHVEEVLKEKKKLENVNVKRITFNEITKEAVNNAINKPRELDNDLINSYLTRRALDYLVGFNLSPILWRKLPGSRSAGRVQSVALRIICERENEIEHFKPEEYWSVDVLLKSMDGEIFKSTLKKINDKKIGKLDIKTESIAKEYVDLINSKTYKVTDIKSKEVKRNPYAPFTTSTLQQDAGNKFGYSAASTMGKAQKLYQDGYITYMRTDSIVLSNDAINQSREYIKNTFGNNYLPNEPRVYKSKAKNAQEAHEAIRPTNINNSPEEIKGKINEDLYELYKLIWKRTVASQMNSAIFKQITLIVESNDNSVLLQSTGSSPVFDGMLKVYNYEKKSDNKDKEKNIIPNIKSNDEVKIDKIIDEQHFTQPPARYTEASLVKKLEELGIGRPSTYAPIIQVLKTRGYVNIESRRIFPQDRGRIVTVFLSNYFEKYIDYDFTANLENKLDEISGGRLNYINVLDDFWINFYNLIKETEEIRIRDVIDKLDIELEDHFFQPTEKNSNPRKCPTCSEGRLGLKLARTGPFIGCSNYPECKYATQLTTNVNGDDQNNGGFSLPKELGLDPKTNKPITIKQGPYGVYVEMEEENQDKPRRSSVPKSMNLDQLTLEKASELLSLPREVGIYPKSNEKILANNGRFGPYLKVGDYFISLKEDDVYTVGENRAINLIEEHFQKIEKKTLGTYEEKELSVSKRGRIGYFLKNGTTSVRVPNEIDAKTISLEKAIELISIKKEKDAEKKKTTRKRKKKKIAS